MTRLEKIEQEAQRAREKIAAMQGVLREIEGKRTEQENLEIVQQIRALKLTREELYTFLGGGGLPGAWDEPGGVDEGEGGDTSGENHGDGNARGTRQIKRDRRKKRREAAQDGGQGDGGDHDEIHHDGDHADEPHDERQNYEGENHYAEQ